MTDAEIMEYLDSNGYPRHIVEAGREGLLRRYREFVAEVEKGYGYGLQDYRNDLDLRGVIATLALDEETSELDHRLDDMLTARQIRVWESVAGDPFWDFGYPRNASGWLLRDLKNGGLLDDASSEESFVS
jgi:hypothetical protein